MKLEKGQEYNIKHTNFEVVGRHQSGQEWLSAPINMNGTYEYIGKRKSKYYFHNNENGADLYLTKDELINVTTKD